MIKKKWAILCSGWGGNAIDVMEKYHHYENYSKYFEINLLIYDNEECGAAQTAKEHNIEYIQIARAKFNNSKLHQLALITELKKRDIDYIFLMNYKYLIRQDMLKNFQNRIINVHPSLFPSFLATKSAIQDALAYGVKITGITTHIIDENYDKGTILLQEPIRVEENDTFETLYPKFRKKGKNILLKTMLNISMNSNGNKKN